ncbi:hypothetical protein [Actinocorallia sp. B10E7]
MEATTDKAASTGDEPGLIKAAKPPVTMSVSSPPLSGAEAHT